MPATAPRSIEPPRRRTSAKDYQCGPAALATLLVASGVDVTPETLAPEVFIPERKGSLALGSLALAATPGCRMLATTADEMVELEAGRPVLVLQNYGVSKIPIWHYAVLIGYDADRNVRCCAPATRSGSK